MAAFPCHSEGHGLLLLPLVGKRGGRGGVVSDPVAAAPDGLDTHKSHRTNCRLHGLSRRKLREQISGTGGHRPLHQLPTYRVGAPSHISPICFHFPYQLRRPCRANWVACPHRLPYRTLVRPQSTPVATVVRCGISGEIPTGKENGVRETKVRLRKRWSTEDEEGIDELWSPF